MLTQGINIQRAAATGTRIYAMTVFKACGEYSVSKRIYIHDVINQNHETTGAEALLHDYSPFC